MPRRRTLKGVAVNFLGWFVSRNNDLDGYWALGKFSSYVANSSPHLLELDFLSGRSVPDIPLAREVSATYREELFRLVDRVGLKHENVAHAGISLQFNAKLEKMTIPDTYGSPFIATAIIVDDLGRRHVAKRRGWCAPHNPLRELRSARGKAGSIKGEGGPAGWWVRLTKRLHRT